MKIGDLGVNTKHEKKNLEKTTARVGKNQNQTMETISLKILVIKLISLLKEAQYFTH